MDSYLTFGEDRLVASTQGVFTWPAPGSHSRIVPEKGSPGSFWEDRGDRRHAGVDLYAPAGTPVLAVEAGTVLEVALFTSPEVREYWNETYSVLMESSGRLLRYAEMSHAAVRPGERVAAGQQVGRVGQVLNLERVDENAPPYIYRLRLKQVHSMLHFEMYSAPPDPQHYLGGNYFLSAPPPALLDPTGYLQALDGRP